MPRKSNQPPFETRELRRELTKFLDSKYEGEKVGNYKFGVYAFFDYDGEPIYVGQTNEKLRTRIRRHLTNMRTDAVAMNVLDPFEVFEIEVWPLPEFEGRDGKDPKAKAALDALEFAVFKKAIEKSKFKAILNEKDPPAAPRTKIPKSLRGCIVSEGVLKLRAHPDIRIARRAQTLARLAQVISERQVQSGLRKTLQTQAARLHWLTHRRFEEAAGSGDDSTDGEA